MFKLKTISLWALIIILALSIVLTGCGKNESPVTTSTTPPVSTTLTTSTQPSIIGEEILSSSIDAGNTLNTFKMAMDIAMTMETTGGTEPMNFTMQDTATSSVDPANKEMMMTMQMSADIPEEGKQEMFMDVYMVDGWYYMKVNMPMIGEQWIKNKMTDELWAEQDQFSRMTELLKSAVKVDIVGSENIGGTDCYVVNITPDMATLMNWAMEQSGSQDASPDLSNIDLSKAFKSFSIKAWIAKDNQLLARESFDMHFEVNSTDLGNSTEDFETMTMSMNGTVNFSDWGQPVNITLPPEAQNAQEIPSMTEIPAFSSGS